MDLGLREYRGQEKEYISTCKSAVYSKDKPGEDSRDCGWRCFSVGRWGAADMKTCLFQVCPKHIQSRMLHDWTCTLEWVLWHLVKGWRRRELGLKPDVNPPAWLQGGVGVKLVHFPLTQHQQRFFISSKPEDISHVSYDRQPFLCGNLSKWVEKRWIKPTSLVRVTGTCFWALVGWAPVHGMYLI